MARFSPTVRPRSGQEGQPRASDRIIQALDMLRRQQLQEEELDLRKERQKAELFERGFSEEAPTEDVRLPASDEDTLTRDIDLGGAPGGARTRRARELESVLFPGSGPAPRMETDRGPGGMAGAPAPSPGGGGPLVDELEGMRRRGPTLPADAETGPRESRGQPNTGALGADEFMIQALDQVRQQGPTPRGEGAAPGEEQDPAVRHPPGAFVPEAMDFTTEAIFEGPQVDTRMGLQRPAPERTVERVPDRVERVGDGLFFDPDRTPTARESDRRMRVIQGLESLRNLDPEERAILEAEAAGISPRAVDLAFDDRSDFTAAELRDAGIPEEQIPAAIRDPILARQLMRDVGEGDFTAQELRDAGIPEERIPAALRDPILARQLLRDAGEIDEDELGFQDRVEDLVASGVPRRRAEGIARDKAAYRDFVDAERGPTSRDDFVGRRQRVQNAVERILDARENILHRFGTPTDEDHDRFEQEVNFVLDLHGYDSIEQLQTDMRRYGVRGEDLDAGGSSDGQAEPGTDAEGDLPPIEQRIDELIAEGLSDEQIAETLREEGYR